MTGEAHVTPEALPSDKGKEEKRLGESREENCRGSVYYKAARTDEDISIKTKKVYRNI